MSSLPNVSSEGGPLIVADFLALHDWKGAFGNGTDYEQACTAISGRPSASLSNRILVWDIGGSGTAFLTARTSNSFSMVRFWSDDDLPDKEIIELFDLAVPAAHETSIHFTSSPAVILWACEDAREIAIPSEPEGIPEGDWSMGGTAYYFPIEPGEYLAMVGSYESEHLILKTLSCQKRN